MGYGDCDLDKYENTYSYFHISKYTGNNNKYNVKECGCFQITISESERCFIYDKHIGIYQCDLHYKSK